MSKSTPNTKSEGTVYQQLSKLIAEQTTARLTKAKRLRDDLQLDSLDISELVMSIEDHFDIELNTADWPLTLTVGELCDIISAEQAKTGV